MRRRSLKNMLLGNMDSAPTRAFVMSVNARSKSAGLRASTS
jgi:hypothetical protein